MLKRSLSLWCEEQVGAMGMPGSWGIREKPILVVQGWVVVARTRPPGGNEESGQFQRAHWRET